MSKYIDADLCEKMFSKIGEKLYVVGEDKQYIREEKIKRIVICKSGIKIHAEDSSWWEHEIDNDSNVYSTRDKAEAVVAKEQALYESAPVWITDDNVKMCPHCGERYRLKTYGDFHGHGGTYQEYQSYDVGRKCRRCGYYVRDSL